MKYCVVWYRLVCADVISELKRQIRFERNSGIEGLASGRSRIRVVGIGATRAHQNNSATDGLSTDGLSHQPPRSPKEASRM